MNSETEDDSYVYKCRYGVPLRQGKDGDPAVRVFNTTGGCNPSDHYMVDIGERLKEIKVLVDAGKYFCINRARQYPCVLG